VQVTDLRSKARLLVQQGATLVGVMDEHGVLQEGQVYVQVRCITFFAPYQQCFSRSCLTLMHTVRRAAGGEGQRAGALPTTVYVSAPCQQCFSHLCLTPCEHGMFTASLLWRFEFATRIWQ
jgi:hypothetical protein